MLNLYENKIVICAKQSYIGQKLFSPPREVDRNY